MHDQLNAPAIPGLAGAPFSIGFVSFSCNDGVGTIQISNSLSEEAARKLETFLRDLIAEDQPKLRALQAQAQSQALQAASRRYNSPLDANDVQCGDWNKN